MWYAHQWTYYSTIIGNKILICATTWLNSKNRPSKRSQSWSTTQCIIPFTWDVDYKAIRRGKNRLCLPRTRGRNEQWLQMSMRFPLGDRNVPNLDSSEVEELCKTAKSHWTVHLRNKFVIYKLYLNNIIENKYYN